MSIRKHLITVHSNKDEFGTLGEPGVFFALCFRNKPRLRKEKYWTEVRDSGYSNSTIRKDGERNMYLIVGLGNPGREYEGTRHNVGFSAVLALSDDCGLSVNTKKFKALIANGLVKGHKAILAMPQTYMNLSGESVREIVDYFQIDPAEELIVIYDDISLEVGQLRIRKKGSAGGHNGMKNIIKMLGTNEFTRVRIGVGAKPEKMDLADYVLGHFGKEEQGEIRDAVKEAAAAVVMIMDRGVDVAMNQYNQAKKKGE